MQLIHRRHLPVDHYVLVDEAGTLPPQFRVAEARRCAGPLAASATGNAQNFTLIHNGAGLARRSVPHVHIICAASRFEKALIYLIIGIKNLLPRKQEGGLSR
jgi:hypothetical protein